MSYQCLKTNGSGYASIVDASQAGLDVGLSDYMLEFRCKALNISGVQHILRKLGTGGYYILRLEADTGRFSAYANDGSNAANSVGTLNRVDRRWHDVVLVVDRSSVTGQKIFVDGAEESYTLQGDITAVGDISNDGIAFFGSANATPTATLTGYLDEARIWNFGYSGLPSDYADYITWRAQGRNVFKDISEYNSGSWNGYADAYRIERITYGALDDDNSDFEGAGVDGTDIEVGTDWVKGNTSAEVDDETGSGVTAYNGSSFCAKIHTASGDYPRIVITGANIDAAFTVGEWYELSFDHKALNTTLARFNIFNAGYVLSVVGLINETSWTTTKVVFQLVDNNDISLLFSSHYSIDEDGTEVLWIDNISIKRIGLVARYKFEGDYLDETSNSNDLTAGGSGNVFPGYTLRKRKSYMPFYRRLGGG